MKTKREIQSSISGNYRILTTEYSINMNISKQNLANKLSKLGFELESFELGGNDAFLYYYRDYQHPY